MPLDVTARLEAKVIQQLGAQRVGYLLGAGSSYLGGKGYPLASQLWELIKEDLPETERNAIENKLAAGATGLEHALDLLDDGGASDTPYRHLVTDALAGLFSSIKPPLDRHVTFVDRLAKKGNQGTKVFSLNYDPLLERAAAHARVRVVDGFLGVESSYFDANVFEERIGQLRGTHKARKFAESAKPVHLLKLHGSLGWYECPTNGIRRGSFDSEPPPGAKRLMVPPQRRKATDTMHWPYAALWSRLRACLAHGAVPINRLACIGYGFADEHVNAIVEEALARADFTLLIFARSLGDEAWNRWSRKSRVIIVTSERCSLYGDVGPGHDKFWAFEYLAGVV